jgi:uncharacterized membrane protein
MNSSQRLAAVLAYVPVIGWLYALATQASNRFVVFHLRQGIGLVLFLLTLFAGWAVLTFAISWVSYGFLIANALFAIVLAAFIYGLFALVRGMLNAAQGKTALLPIFGQRALNLPIGTLR